MDFPKIKKIRKQLKYLVTHPSHLLRKLQHEGKYFKHRSCKTEITNYSRHHYKQILRAKIELAKRIQQSEYNRRPNNMWEAVHKIV